MKKYQILLMLILTLTIFSCNKEPTYIRLKNNSTYTFNHTKASFNSSLSDFGTLDPGQVSEYKEYESSYNYGTSIVVIGQDTLWSIAIDYVGERLIEPGHYTYELSIVSEDDTLQIRTAMEKD
jgi:hypothetical protein